MITQRLLSRALHALLCVALWWTPVAAASSPRVDAAGFVVERVAAIRSTRPRLVEAAQHRQAPLPAPLPSYSARTRELSRPATLAARPARAPLYLLHQALLR